MKSWRKAIVGTDATVSEAIAAIESGSIQVALVLDGSSRLVGIVTDGDIRRGLLRGMQLSGPATEIMNRSAVSAPATLSREERLHLMRQKSIKQLPLLDGSGQLIGVETFDELLEAPHYPNPVLIMAGGLGERLGALTRERPKPMLNVGGRPLLETIIRNVVQQGFRNIFISVNYMAEMIVEHFGDGSALGATIQYVHEAERLGTAGALGLLPQPSELPVVVTNGDILTTINYGALLDFHNGTSAEATMAVREHKVHVPYGVVTANDGYLETIREKPTEILVCQRRHLCRRAERVQSRRTRRAHRHADGAGTRRRQQGPRGGLSDPGILARYRPDGGLRAGACRIQRGLPVSPINAVVVGLGSIGQRHARVLRELGHGVTTVSRRGDGDYTSIADALAAVRPDMLLSRRKHRSMPNRFASSPRLISVDPFWWKSRSSRTQRLPRIILLPASSSATICAFTRS